MTGSTGSDGAPSTNAIGQDAASTLLANVVDLAANESVDRGPVYFERSTDTPLASVTVMIAGSAAEDPIGLDGMAYHVGELAVRGAGDRNRRAIDIEFDRLGTGISVVTARDALTYSATCLARHLPTVVELLQSILSEPRFDDAEHQKLVRETRSDLAEMRDSDADLVSRFFARYFCPGHPHARSIEGDEASLSKLALESGAEMLVRFTQLTRSRQVAIGFSGSLEKECAMTCASKLLAPLEPSPAAPPPKLRGPWPSGVRVYLVEKSERSQSQILIGHRAPHSATEDGAALVLTEAAFGGMFSSRLMQEVRVKRGWSYDVSMAIARARIPSWTRISLAPSSETTIDAIDLVLKLYSELINGGLAAGELDLARRFTVNNLLLGRATPRQRVRRQASAFVHDMPSGYLTSAPEIFAGLSLANVNDAIAKHLSVEDLTIVVVGGKELAAPLSKFGDVEIVNYRSY